MLSARTHDAKFCALLCFKRRRVSGGVDGFGLRKSCKPFIPKSCSTKRPPCSAQVHFCLDCSSSALVRPRLERGSMNANQTPAGTLSNCGGIALQLSLQLGWTATICNRSVRVDLTPGRTMGFNGLRFAASPVAAWFTCGSVHQRLDRTPTASLPASAFQVFRCAPCGSATGRTWSAGMKVGA